MSSIRIYILLLILLVACAPKPVSSPQSPTLEKFQMPVTWTPQATQLSTVTPPRKNTLAPTFTLEPTYTLIASLTPLPEVDSGATPVLGTCLRSEDACEISVRTSSRRGWCSMSSIRESCGLIYNYSLLYPQNWVIDTMGVLHPNLEFYTGSENTQFRLYQLPASGLTLDNAEKGQLCNENGDCLPVVSPQENIVRRQLRVYAGRDYLFLTSSLGDSLITRHFVFLNHAGLEIRLYVIEIRLPSYLLDSEEYNLLLEQAKVMLGSLQPDTRVEVTPSTPSETPLAATATP